MVTPKFIAASAYPSSASGQFGLKIGKASRLSGLLAWVLVFAGATSHASVSSVPPASIGCFSEIGDGYLVASLPTATDPQTGEVNTATTSVAYSYDAAGNQQGDGLKGYHYDSEGRLARITLGSATNAPSVHYAHNALGQRVFKTDIIYSAGTASSPTTQNGQSSNQPRITLLGDEDGDEDLQAKPTGLLQTFKDYWLRLWSPQTDSTQAQGRAFVYAEDGSLLGEYSMEANPAAPPTQGAQHIWLPTASGPMPIAVVGEGRQYAVHADHLNTPRRLTQEDGKVAWQWAYSAFGDEQPTTAANRFTSESTNPTTGSTSVPQVQYSLRYPGQYYDEETSLHYNYFRSYDSRTGRYTQGDPIGLGGGWNRFVYVGANPLSYTDPGGLAIGDFPPPPPGYNSQSWTQGSWPNNNKTYLRDPSGNTWTIHPEDKGHWRHWDKQDSDGNDDGTWPPNAKKPWLGQKKLKDSQCPVDPSGDAPPWDPMNFADPTPDYPQLWAPSWLSPRPNMSPRVAPRISPRFVFP